MSENTKFRKDSGVSEVIATILLIALVVIGSTIIGVMITSNPPPKDIPKSSIQIINNSQYHDRIFFYHGGGDSLPGNEVIFKKNGVPVDKQKVFIGFPKPDGKIDDWKIWGNNSDLDWNYTAVIKLEGPEIDPRSSYQIIYTGGSGEYLLKEYGAGIATDSGPIGNEPVVCGVHPAAGFTISNSGLEYTFTASDTESTTYHSWQIVGGHNVTSSSGKVFSYVFPVPDEATKTYPVQHIVYNMTDGVQTCTRSSTDYVTLSCTDAKCDTDFEYSITNNEVTFKITEPDPDQVINCSWNYGDGTFSTEKNPVEPKIYVDGISEHLVTLTITKDRCGYPFSCSITKKVATESTTCNCFSAVYDETTTNPWKIDFSWKSPSASGSSDCGGINVNDDWFVVFDFGDGNKTTYYKRADLGSPVWPSSTINRISHSYVNCGDYSVKMSVIDMKNGREYYSCTRTVQTPCICTDPPIANFSVIFDRTTLLASFQDLSSAPSITGRSLVRWDWDFGDGSPVQSSTTAPLPFTHSYPACGNYIVKLTVFDSNNCWSSTTRTVSCGGAVCEDGAIIASFSVVQPVPGVSTFTLTDHSTTTSTIQRWEWDMGDGKAKIIQTTTPGSFQYSYDNCGSYPVRLRVQDEFGCWDDKVIEVRCDCPIPVAQFRVETTSDPLRFQFVDESSGNIVGYEWEFGDGQTSTEQSPTHSYTACSQYTVRLKVTSDCGSFNETIRDAICGCPPPEPEFEFKCIGERLVNLTDLSRSTNPIVYWGWEFGDGTTYSGPNPPNHEYQKSGTYLVNLSARTQCNSIGSWSRYVTVPCCIMPTPDFTFTCLPDTKTVRFIDTSKSYGDNITTWQWNFGDNSQVQSGQNVDHTYARDGTWPVTLTVTSPCGSNISWTRNVTVPCYCSAPQAQFTAEVLKRKPLTIRYIDTSVANGGIISAWNWTFGDGTTSSMQNPTDHVFSGCGAYITELRVMKDCGTYDDTEQRICCPVYADFSYRMDPANGEAPVTTYFTDLTEGTPNAWDWFFGDGDTSTEQNPVHVYKKGGNYTVTLHATSPCGGNETKSKQVQISCSDVFADFSYTIVSEEPFNVSFRDLSYGGEIVDWLWLFGDGTTSKEQNPYHVFQARENYNVGLIVTNDCGKTSQIWRRIAFECPNLTSSFNVTPSSGLTPLEVRFSENSTPLDKIKSWYWIFGDGTNYYTTNRNLRVPENHTYSRVGTYYVTLQIQNECGNPFTQLKTVNVTGSANISGALWNDRNKNKIWDPEEGPLSGWTVTLQERIANSWVDRYTQVTNTTGVYRFAMNDITYGAFRVVETLLPRWNVTYSLGPDPNVASQTLLISSTRQYDNVNYGNVRTNTSTFEFPLLFYYGEVGSGVGGTQYNMNVPGQYWDYNTSYNWERQKLFYPPPYLISYTAQGDSSFNVTIGFYARYLIFLQNNNYPPIDRSYWLRYWMYNSQRTNGFSFFVPDNTVITRPDLFFERDDNRWFELYIPFEGSAIPYSSSSYVEAHMTGTRGSTTGCTLIAPGSQQMTWNNTWGYFTGNWDNRAYEGQWITITASNDFGTIGTPRFLQSSKNVFVNWEPLTPVITSPVNNTAVSGTIQVKATVGGHNRDVNNVQLLLNNQSVGSMTYWIGNDTFTYNLNVEPFAGKTIPISARAYPLTGRGVMVDSTPVYLRAQSTLPIQANFTADPWTGPSPLEVSFTDLSNGGPTSWLWNFGDSTGSTQQNPIHTFQNGGNYSVSLQVLNLQGNPSTITRYVNVTGQLKNINLLTTRNGVLNPGYSSWIVQGSGSSITINNTMYSFANGNRVRIDVNQAQNRARIVMAGGISAFNVSNATLKINDILIDSGSCTAINIPDFDNYHSNLQLVSYRNNTALINFVWDSAPITIPTYRNLEINTIMPSTIKTLELDLKPAEIYLDGRASSYRLYT